MNFITEIRILSVSEEIRYKYPTKYVLHQTYPPTINPKALQKNHSNN